MHFIPSQLWKIFCRLREKTRWLFKDMLNIIVTSQIIDAVMQLFSSIYLFLTESIRCHSNFYHWPAKYVKISRGTARLNPQKSMLKKHLDTLTGSTKSFWCLAPFGRSWNICKKESRFPSLLNLCNIILFCHKEKFT